MNEYRFRAYLKYEKKMVDVKAMDWDTEGNIIYIYYLEGKYYLGYKKNDINDIIIMQYTGFKDKDGKEIYEGDVVKYYNNLYQVKRATLGFCISRIHPNKFELELIANTDKKPEMIKESLEIVGNIYENPELLESSKG